MIVKTERGLALEAAVEAVDLAVWSIRLASEGGREVVVGLAL